MNFDEGYKDLPVDKINRQMRKPHALRDTAKFKQMAQQKYEYGADNPGWGEGGKIKDAHERRKPERAAKAYKKRREDKEKANREGKGSHQKVVPGIKGTDKDKLEKLANEETMNFTQFLESEVQPLYQVEDKVPTCPPGYKWDKKTMRCLPKTEKDKITPDGANYNDKDLKPGNGPSYNVWGATGLNGDGYALEEK